MKELCIKCKTRVIYVKSRKLCESCVQKFYQHRRKKEKPSLLRQHTHKIRFNNEVEFIKSFFTHSNWIYQPATFRFNDEIYQPDFYDGERNVFIEVAGTRQAFYDNKEKYQKFVQTFQKIQFEIRYTSGVLLLFNETECTFHENPEKR